MVTILACCANGSGTSIMMSMTLDRVINAQGYKVSKTHHCALSEGRTTAQNYDIVLCPQNFIHMCADAEAKGSKVIGLNNVMSGDEMAEKLENCGIDLRK